MSCCLSYLKAHQCTHKSNIILGAEGALLEGLVRARLIPAIFSQEKSPGWLCKNYWAGCWAQSSSHQGSPESPPLSQALLRLCSVLLKTREAASCHITRSTTLTICPFCLSTALGIQGLRLVLVLRQSFCITLGRRLNIGELQFPFCKMGSTLLYLFRLSAQ